ncbi:hypothetical protein [Mediterraneibacter sp.]|uniref:hypothetical protein n=1 Tax=Mediterraneibacter sp. TaxID=2316022 RepID=UPI0039919991
MGKFTAEEIQIAKAVDLVDLAEQIGIPLKRKGRFYQAVGMDSVMIFNLLWSSIFVTLMANKIGGLQFGIYRNCQISSRVFHTAVAALPLTKANRSDFE